MQVIAKPVQAPTILHGKPEEWAVPKPVIAIASTSHVDLASYSLYANDTNLLNTCKALKRLKEQTREA